MLHLTGDKRFDRLTVLALLLLAFAYGSHLTYLPTDPREDEVRRALVTYEMMVHGDYITPTLYGLPYLNKPPLYNWLLLGCFKVFGINEWALRIPVFLAIFLFGYFIYRETARWLDKKTAVLAALFMMTNGRILLYDSLLGLIDIFYGSLVYLGFMLGYRYSRENRWQAFYLSTYLLVAIGYMLKGLPSIVFQGILLFSTALLLRQIRFIFHKAHVWGLLVFGGIVGAYYAIYFGKNGLGQSKLFGRLVTESTMRTFIESPLKDLLNHLATYPFLFIYHYAPWTLYILLLFRKGIISRLKESSFLWFHVLLFLPGFAMYYASPYVIPRYLFMILPLLFTPLAWQYEHAATAGVMRMRRVIDTTLTIILALLGIGCLILPFLAVSAPVEWRMPKAWAVAAGLLLVSFLAWKHRGYPILYLIMGVILIRVGFNFFVIEQRGGYQRDQAAQMQQVMQMADSAGKRLFLETGADLGNADNMAYQYMLRKREILFEASPTDSIGLFITDEPTKNKQPHRIWRTWAGPYQPELFLVEYGKK